MILWGAPLLVQWIIIGVWATNRIWPAQMIPVQPARNANIALRENSLGMKFVPALRYSNGKTVLFCIWETRVGDYRKYADANNGVNGEWKEHRFARTEDHPVDKVNWNDAASFCQWLTAKERRDGLIGEKDEYRLPMDAEWSFAVGIGKDECMCVRPGKKGAAPGYVSTIGTSPVGGFGGNELGIFGLSGNVWEWCEDYYDGKRDGRRVLRGGSGVFSCRSCDDPANRLEYIGFRCVFDIY